MCIYTAVLGLPVWAEDTDPGSVLVVSMHVAVMHVPRPISRFAEGLSGGAMGLGGAPVAAFRRLVPGSEDPVLLLSSYPVSATFPKP